MRRSASLLLALLAAFALPAYAADKPQSGKYTLDPSHTMVIFNIGHMGLSHYFGRFNQAQGTLQLDAEKPEKSTLNVTVPIKSLDTKNTQLDAILLGKDWFNADEYAEANFTSTRIEKTGDSTAKIYGDLTLRGKRVPLVIDAKLNGAGKNPVTGKTMIGFSGSATLLRDGLGMLLYPDALGNVVALTLEAEFERQE